MPISSGKVVDSAEIGLRVSVLRRTRLEEKERRLYCTAIVQMKHSAFFRRHHGTRRVAVRKGVSTSCLCASLAARARVIHSVPGAFS